MNNPTRRPLPRKNRVSALAACAPSIPAIASSTMSMVTLEPMEDMLEGPEVEQLVSESKLSISHELRVAGLTDERPELSALAPRSHHIPDTDRRPKSDSEPVARRGIVFKVWSTPLCLLC